MKRTSTLDPSECRAGPFGLGTGLGPSDPRRWSADLIRLPGVCVIVCLMAITVPAVASDITFEPIVRVGDVPPGRESDDVLFRGSNKAGDHGYPAFVQNRLQAGTSFFAGLVNERHGRPEAVVGNN